VVVGQKRRAQELAAQCPPHAVAELVVVVVVVVAQWGPWRAGAVQKAVVAAAGKMPAVKSKWYDFKQSCMTLKLQII
jgi:hypothetical protein